jgi:hypothetical protein
MASIGADSVMITVGGTVRKHIHCRRAWALLRNLANALFDPYRPELHYMRGPGPKSRAKHRPPL